MKGRKERLVPEGVPRYVRCYDAGDHLADMYTVVFTGVRGRHSYVGMSAHPFHPQGVCSHGENQLDRAIDTFRGWPPAMGRKCHLGKRIPYVELPPDCKKLVMSDYEELWRLGKE